MKKLLLILSLLMISYETAAALKNGPYLALRGGLDSSKIKTDDLSKRDEAFAGVIAIGARAHDVRVELELTAETTTKVEELKTEQQRYLAQFYYDLPFHFPIRPYLNAGAGMAYTDINYKLENKKESDDKTKFAWNAGGGLALNVTSNLSFDLGYRYIDTGKIKVKDCSIDTMTHEFYFGGRVTF